MFHILVTGLCLAAASTPITAQLHQNALGFQPTNNLTVVKVPPVGWGSPPPPPQGGWPAPPPPPPPPPNRCQTSGTPVYPAGVQCPNPDNAYATYFPSTDCSCFFECSNGVAIGLPCSSGLYWSSSINNCVEPAVSGCTPT